MAERNGHAKYTSGMRVSADEIFFAVGHRKTEPGGYFY